jgi:hypothetical protein
MKIAESIVATTHIDRQNDKLALSALEGMAEQIKREYIPLLHEHDPRIPPHGRLISAQIEQLEDGEYALKCAVELFEPGDEIPLSDETREIPIWDVSPNYLEVIYDRSYIEEVDQTLLAELVTTTGGTKQEYGKKGLDPLSILIIAGSFVAGNFAVGFLQKMGADAWDKFKNKLKKLAEHKRAKGIEHVFQFQFIIHLDGKPTSIEVNLTNPTDNEIDIFLQTGIQDLDKIMMKHIGEKTYIRKLVYEYAKGRLNLSFAIRKDAVPLFPKSNSKKRRTKRHK